jgi:hypothetical protein
MPSLHFETADILRSQGALEHLKLLISSPDILVDSARSMLHISHKILWRMKSLDGGRLFSLTLTLHESLDVLARECGNGRLSCPALLILVQLELQVETPG